MDRVLGKTVHAALRPLFQFSNTMYSLSLRYPLAWPCRENRLENLRCLDIQMSKAQLEAQCRYILNRYDVKAFVTDPDDEAFLLDLFQRHPEWEQKKGVGIDVIQIQKSEFGSRCFVLLRLDGTSTDISFQKCLRKPTKEQAIRQACRTAIRPRIYAYREANVIYGETRCAVTGEILTKKNTTIDHYDLTFDEMFRLWVSNQYIDLVYAGLAPSTDHSYGRVFADISIVEDFIRFHDDHCKLRAVTAKANSALAVQHKRQSKQDQNGSPT
jgi:hypothetical protein